jgi:predicted nucleotidyltransferase
VRSIRYTTFEDIMQDFITSKREEIAELCRRHHVRRLAIFGSAVRDDFDPERSDVDVLVRFDPIIFPKYLDHYSGLRQGLEALLGRDVDLLREGVIKNVYRLKSIQQDEKEIYAA